LSLEQFATAPARHQSLYDTIAASHPSLLAGKVWCGRCGKPRTVDPAKCLQHGWPKCCDATMGLAKPAEVKPEP
jgi:hypothetical protein